MDKFIEIFPYNAVKGARVILNLEPITSADCVQLLDEDKYEVSTFIGDISNCRPFIFIVTLKEANRILDSILAYHNAK